MGNKESSQPPIIKTNQSANSKHICQQKSMADLEASVDAIIQEAKNNNSFFAFDQIACYLKVMLKYAPLVGNDRKQYPVIVNIGILSKDSKDKPYKLAVADIASTGKGGWSDVNHDSLIKIGKNINNFFDQLLDIGDEYPLIFITSNGNRDERLYFKADTPNYIKRLWVELFMPYHDRHRILFTYPVVNDQMYCPPNQTYKVTINNFSTIICYLEKLFKTLPDKVQYVVRDEHGDIVYQPTGSGSGTSKRPKEAVGNLAIKIKEFKGESSAGNTSIPDDQTNVYLLTRNEQGWSFYLNGNLISHNLGDVFKTLFKLKHKYIEIDLYPDGLPHYAGLTQIRPLYKTKPDPYLWNDLGQIYIAPDFKMANLKIFDKLK